MVSGKIDFLPSETPDSDIYLKSPFTDTQIKEVMRLETDYRAALRRVHEDYEARKAALLARFREEDKAGYERE